MTTFAYYTREQSDQYSFYRFPRVLFTDPIYKGLSCEAKVLYGLCLDQMSLSRENGWIDEYNRVYIIFTIDRIRDMMCCSKEKACKILAELDAKKGIGLIERVRQGQGRPDIIYVKNFAAVGQLQKEAQSENRDCPEFSEVGKTDFKKSEKPTSRSTKNRPQEVGKTDPNYININKTNRVNKSNPISSINTCTQSTPQGHRGYDEMDEIQAYREIVEENIGYQYLMDYFPLDQSAIKELTELIIETVSVPREKMLISGVEYPWQVVKAKFLKLNMEHVKYVISSLQNNNTQVRSMRGYLLTCLFNAPTTMSNYYRSLVNYHMADGRLTGS